MVQTETSGKTCLDIGEVQPIAAERPMVQTETSGKTCLDIGEVQPIAAERLRRIFLKRLTKKKYSGVSQLFDIDRCNFVRLFTATIGSN